MSATYPQYPNASFPDSICSADNMSDVTLAMKPYVDQYYTYWNAGNFTAANALLETYPVLKTMKLDANKFNILLDEIKASQKFYKDDVQTYIQELIHNRGAWVDTTQYVKYDYVSYELEGVTGTYECISDVTVPIGTVPTNVTYWVSRAIQGEKGDAGLGLSFAGVWNDTITYTVDQSVSHNNAIWACAVENIDSEPTLINTNWVYVVSFDASTLPYSNPDMDATTVSEALDELKTDVVTAQDVADTAQTDATNANNKIDNSFNADLEVYYGNVKTIDDFNSVSVWTQQYGTLAQDTTNVKIGTGSIRITETDSTAKSLYAYKNSISLNLSVLNNGEATEDSDYIYLAYYVSNVAYLDFTSGYGVRISFGADASFSVANSFTYTITSGVVTGWNYAKILKSDFSTTGTISWSNIQSIRVFWRSLASATGVYVSFQLLQFVKADPTYSYPNPFQKNGVADFSINDGEWFIGKEFGNIVLKEISAVSSIVNSLRGVKTFGDCTITNTIQALNNYACRYIGGIVDSNNLFYTYSTNTLIYLIIVIDGVSTQVTTSATVAINDTISYEVQRQGTSIFVKAVKNGDYNNPYWLTGEFSNTGKVNLMIGKTTVQTYHNNISITEISHAHHADIAEVAKSLSTIIKSTTALTAGTSALATDYLYFKYE